MKTWIKCCSGLVTVASLTPLLFAQVPPVPPPPPAVAAAAAVPAPASVVVQQKQCCCLAALTQMKAACKQAICASPIGALLNNAMEPVSALAGGLLPPICPTLPTPADIAAMEQNDPGGAETVAAKIKVEEADAKARKAAVRYLGTVDCNWFPDAQGALIKSLLHDRNECVRLEAALALSRGCCCSKATVAALTLVVNGTRDPKEGNVPENSERVRDAAQVALEGCLARLKENPPPAEAPRKELKGTPPVETPKSLPPVENPRGLGSTNLPLTPFLREVDKKSARQVIDEAKLAVEQAHQRSKAVAHKARAHSVMEIFVSVSPQPSPATVQTTEAPPVVLTPTPAVQPTTYLRVVEPTPSPVVQAPPVDRAPTPQPSSTVVTANTTTPATSTYLWSRPVAKTPVQGKVSTGDAKHVLETLQNSTVAAKREQAAYELAKFNWQADPAIALALVKAAFEDQTPSVRVACIRCLGNMNVNLQVALNTLNALRIDPDAQVQREAKDALAKLTH